MREAITTITLLATLSMAAAHAANAAGKVKEPRLKPDAHGATVDLGPDADAALKQFNPNFQLYSAKDFNPLVLEEFAGDNSAAPMAILGDYNGDKVKDIALFGHDDKNQITVALVSTNEGYTAIEIVPPVPYQEPNDIIYPPKEVNTDNVRSTGLYEYLSEGHKVKNVDTVQTEEYRGSTKSYYAVPDLKCFAEYRVGKALRKSAPFNGGTCELLNPK